MSNPFIESIASFLLIRLCLAERLGYFCTPRTIEIVRVVVERIYLSIDERLLYRSKSISTFLSITLLQFHFYITRNCFALLVALYHNTKKICPCPIEHLFRCWGELL